MARGTMLKYGLVCCVAVAAAAAGWRYAPGRAGPTDLKIEYGRQGVARLSYKGVVLEDVEQNPSDGFHIWHMKMTGLDGKPRKDGPYGWGENNSGRSWDEAAHAWTYRFPWGSITVRFVQNGNRLDMRVTETNDAGSGVILDGATIYPLALRPPRVPEGFGESATAHLASNADGPSVTVADYGKGEVAVVVPEAGRPLYSGFVATSQAGAYAVVLSGTAPDEMAKAQTRWDRPVAPGETESFTVSLRFAPAGTDPAALVADVYADWAQRWPATLRWPDRRMIGTVYLASSPPSHGDASRPGGSPNNPRRYFHNAGTAAFDVQTREGLARFQERVLRQARESVDILRRLRAQGAITWDIEGEEYPQETSYVCAPDQIARVAPEMESTVGDPASPYRGMKLDDAYFKTFRDAGFRVGVCVRPQRFTPAADGTARQASLPEEESTAELIGKMKYAHDRWGATLFYLDSTVDQGGATLPTAVLRKAAAALPDSLLIPEETTARDYAYTAPFQSFLFHGDLGTDAAVRRVYPGAFSVNLVNDVEETKLVVARETLTESVRRGDILMPHADFWHPNNTMLTQMYEEAGREQ